LREASGNARVDAGQRRPPSRAFVGELDASLERADTQARLAQL